MKKTWFVKPLATGLLALVSAAANAGNINETFDTGLPLGGIATGPARHFVPGDIDSNFDTTLSPGTTATGGAAPGPVITPGGPTGNFMRITQDAGSNHNTVAADRSVFAPFQNYIA